jgi:hypothetical protein
MKTFWWRWKNGAVERATAWRSLLQLRAQGTLGERMQGGYVRLNITSRKHERHLLSVFEERACPKRMSHVTDTISKWKKEEVPHHKHTRRTDSHKHRRRRSTSSSSSRSSSDSSRSRSKHRRSNKQRRRRSPSSSKSSSRPPAKDHQYQINTKPIDDQNHQVIAKASLHEP